MLVINFSDRYQISILVKFGDPTPYGSGARGLQSQRMHILAKSKIATSYQIVHHIYFLVFIKKCYLKTLDLECVKTFYLRSKPEVLGPKTCFLTFYTSLPQKLAT